MVKSHRTGKDRMMEEIFRWLSIGFIAGLWLSLEECESSPSWNSNTGGQNVRLICCKTHSAKTCFMRCLFNETHPEHTISEESCEVHGWTWVDSEDAERSLSYCANISISDNSQDPNIPESTDENEPGSGDNQCVCISLHWKIKDTAGLARCDDKCLKRNRNHNCCIVRNKGQEITHAVTSEIPSSSSQEKIPSDAKPTTTTTPSKRTTTTTTKTTTTTTTPRMTTTITVKTHTATSSIPSHATNQPRTAEENNSSDTTTIILLILLLFVTIIIIIAAVVLFMRKRKFEKRNELSPVTYTSQSETVTNVYADNGTSGGTAPAGNHIYDELDIMTLDPTPSNVYSTQPTSVAVDMGKSADYVDIDLPMNDQQKPMNSSKAALSLSPVYSQPFEPSSNNTEYAEPFKPDTTNTATAPVLNHSSAAGDQQDGVYSLAAAIPLSDANVIYSQPNKPTKSTGPTDESGGSTDPIHSEATGVEPGAESRGSATQDPNAVYAEPMKLKKSS